MTIKIRSASTRIILLLIVAGMILGLFYSAVCDGSYDAVSGSSSYRNEISAPLFYDTADFIADNSANADQTSFLTERSKPVRPLLAGFVNTALTEFKSCGILSADACIFLLCVLLSASFRHIFYIHLKDGDK